MPHLGRIVRPPTSKGRRDKVEASARFKIITKACGNQIVNKPLSVAIGDVFKGTVMEVEPTVLVHLFLEGSTEDEDAVLVDTHGRRCGLCRGDIIVCQVSNTSGGRKKLLPSL